MLLSETQLLMDPAMRLFSSGSESGAPRMPMVEPMGMFLSWSSATVSTLKSDYGMSSRALMALMTGCNVPFELTYRAAEFFATMSLLFSQPSGNDGLTMP